MRVGLLITVVAPSLMVAWGWPGESAASRPPTPLCLPPRILQGADIVVLDQHGGRGAPSNLDLGGSRHPTHVVSVEAGAAGRPIVLIAGAYEPTVWDVSAVAPSRLRAVVAYGFYPPAVTGSARSTTVRFGALGNDGDWSGSPGCEPINLAFSGTGRADRYSEQIESVFGTAPSLYYGGFDPSGYDIDDGSLPSVRHALAENLEPELPNGVEPAYVDRPQRIDGAFAWGGTINTSLRWVDGRLVLPGRTAGPAVDRPVRTSLPYSVPTRASAPKDHRNDDMDLLLELLSAGAVCSLGFAWHQRRRIRLGSDRTEQADRAEGPDVPAARMTVEALKDLCTEEASRSAIVRFEDAAAALRKVALDPDLREQASTTISRDAAQLASATHRAMSSTDRPCDVERSSREAVDRLTAHLHRLHDEQRRRDEDALGTTQGFLRTRYPSAEDPFALS